MSSLTPPLKWHGGKHYLANRIIGLMPPRDSWLHYVEPYFGGGAVLLANDPEGISEVVNDIDHDLTFFWKILQDPENYLLFKRKISAVPFSEHEFKQSLRRRRDVVDLRPWWDKAVDFFIVARQSLAGRMDGFAPITRSRTRRGMNEQASAWAGAVDGLDAVHARLRRVVILDAQDALKVIAKQDGPRTLFYLDPPYLHETRASIDAYAHEMTAAEHDQLLRVISDMQGRFLLSGYRSKLYDLYAKAGGWQRHDFELPNNAAGGKDKRRMTECVWTNY